MTGFGSAERGGVSVEVRSLNHRFMEIGIKLLPGLGRHEMAMREAIKRRFARGRFDVFVSVSGAAGVRLRFNGAMAGEVYSALGKLKEELSLAGEITLEHLLHWRGLLVEEELACEEAPLFDAFSEAMEGLEDMRLREGEALAAEILSRVEEIRRLSEEVGTIFPSIMDEARERFMGRLRELLGDGPFDEARVMQEASAVAARMDISEELSRMGNHLGQMRRILGDGGMVGRKLDFLLQELQREANTIVSKAEDYRVLRNVIDMKAEIERAREQTQNVQ